ncbi:MAG: Lrp/AsnC ligand binding domain-containing protein [Candidatus Nitrosotenuis sp.]
MSITKNNNDQRSKIFVLISCIDGKIDSVFEKINKIDSVSHAQKTDGAYDIMVILESDSDDELKKVLTHKIRTINDVKYTLTLRSSSDNHN